MSGGTPPVEPPPGEWPVRCDWGPSAGSRKVRPRRFSRRWLNALRTTSPERTLTYVLFRPDLFRVHPARSGARDVGELARAGELRALLARPRSKWSERRRGRP